MKQNLQVLVLLGTLTTALTFHSCQLEGEDIGDLYGRWKLVTIFSAHDTIAQPDTVFLSFQAEVFQYQPNWQYDWGTFELTSSSLTLNPLAYRSSFGFKDLMHNEVYDGSKPIVFQVELLNNDAMRLNKNDSTWVFRKYIE